VEKSEDFLFDGVRGKMLELSHQIRQLLVSHLEGAGDRSAVDLLQLIHGPKKVSGNVKEAIFCSCSHIHV